MHMKNTKKKTLTGLLICIFLIAALFLGGKLLFYHVSDAENIWYFSGDTAQRIENIQMLPEHALDDYDSLMVVAHPDDETIWGGAHLLKRQICRSLHYKRKQPHPQKRVCRCHETDGFLSVLCCPFRIKPMANATTGKAAGKKSNRASTPSLHRKTGPPSQPTIPKANMAISITR